MTDLESLGDAATGAVVAGAVEPGAGEGGDGHSDESNCLNCGSALVGDYCHHCGQRAHVHRSLKGFFHDLLHGAHFEGKIWRTLPKLIGNPGELTRRYIDGERARFVSPVALFLFSVFLMFAVFGLAGPALGPSSPQMRAEIAAEVAVEKARLERLESERAKAAAARASTGAIDSRIAETRSEVAMLERIRDRGIATGALGGAPRAGAGGAGWFEDAYRKARQNPDLLIYKLKTNAYKFSWALIPLSVPFLWLLFPFSRRFRLYDHAVFVTYSLSFMTLLVIAGLLVGTAGLGSIASLAFLVPPIHMYLQLKDAYGLTRLGALWRTVLLVSFAFVAVTVFALLLLTLGVLD